MRNHTNDEISTEKKEKNCLVHINTLKSHNLGSGIYLRETSNFMSQFYEVRYSMPVTATEFPANSFFLECMQRLPQIIN